MAESFFATLECELLDRTTLSTHAEARAALFQFVEGWYNTLRRHSALGYVSPLEFERRHTATAVDGERPVEIQPTPVSEFEPESPLPTLVVSTISPADVLRGSGPLGAREGAGDVAAGRIERSARPLPIASAGLDQAAQRLVCGATPGAVLDGHLIARQADRAVDAADGTGPASSRTPHPAAEQAGPQVLRAPVADALSSLYLSR